MSGFEFLKKSRSLFFKYMALFLSVEIISIIAFGVVLAYYVTQSQKDVQKTTLYEYTDKIADVYISSLGSGDEYAESLCYSVFNISQAAKADIYIVNSIGNVLYCQHMIADDGSIIQKPACFHSVIQIPREICIGIASDGVMATEGDLSGLYDENTFIAASAVNLRFNDYIIVLAAQSYEAGIKNALMAFLQIYIMAAVVLISVTGLIVYIITYNITRPLRDMSEATNRYAKGDFSYRIKQYDSNTVKEFHELSTAMNSMADSLESLENSRSNFVANVSHELKTPMTTIGGFIDGILDGTIGIEKQEHYLKIVSEEVKRLSRLVVSMLNMTKIEAGELRIEPVKFNISELITGIFISFEQKIEAKEIDIKGLEKLRSTIIEADADMINQVFYNLIDNAVKFTNYGGEIIISMKNDGDNISVTIKNSGTCISPKDIDHIFERFYKVDKSRSMDAKSAGLGLFIVKNIVELHNGDISVCTVDEKYTQFTVDLKAKLINI